MGAPVQSSSTSVTAAASISRTLAGTTAGNLIVWIVSWIETAVASSNTLGVPSGFTAASNPASSFNAGVGACGTAIFYQISAGGSVSATSSSPFGGTTDFYANAILLEVANIPASPLDAVATVITNNSAASTTGTTIGPTGTLAQATEYVVAAVSVAATTGLANAGITNPPTGYTSLLVDQNTTSSVGTEAAWKDVSSTTGVSATWAWTADASMTQYQAVLVTFKATGGGGGSTEGPHNFQDGIPGAYYADPGFAAIYGHQQQGIPLANRDSQTTPTTVTGAFSSAGVETSIGVGASIASGAASSAGVSSVIGVGASFASADISEFALATVTGVPNAISAATITAAAVATMIGVGQNAGSIVTGDGSIIGTSSMIGVGASTAAGVIAAAVVETSTGVGASTVAGVITEAAVGQAFGAGASSGGNVIISADGSITAGGSANGTGASTVAADIHASAVVTVKGSSIKSSRVVYGGEVRRALKQQQLMLDRDERDLLELAAMLAPLMQGGALWHH